MILDYEVLVHTDEKRLSREVNLKIGQGYYPVGGVVMVQHSVFAQTMILTEDSRYEAKVVGMRNGRFKRLNPSG